jgi:hypothetical protein
MFGLVVSDNQFSSITTLSAWPFIPPNILAAPKHPPVFFFADNYVMKHGFFYFKERRQLHFGRWREEGR